MRVDQTKPVSDSFIGRMLFERGHLVPCGNGSYELPECTSVLFGINDDGAGELFMAKVEGDSDRRSFVTHGESTLDAMNAALLKHYRNGLALVR